MSETMETTLSTEEREALARSAGGYYWPTNTEHAPAKTLFRLGLLNEMGGISDAGRKAHAAKGRLPPKEKVMTPETPPTSNFPPPSGAADEIIAKAIELLGRDARHSVTDNYVIIRDVLIDRENCNIVISMQEIDVLKYGKPSAPYREAFKEALNAALTRKREKLLQPIKVLIEDEQHDTKLAKEQRLTLVRTIGLCLAVAAIFAATVGGVASCSINDSKKAAARDAAVNKYGFKRGGIIDRKTYPDDCASSGFQYGNDSTTYRRFRSIYECKSVWTEWESRGEVWVDWKEEPAT